MGRPKLPLLKKICKLCNSSFEIERYIKRDYCSKKCSASDRFYGEIKICANCGIDFKIRASKSEESKYCSFACYNNFRHPFKNIEEKFLSSFVEKDKKRCWEWLCSLNGKGYGYIRWEDKNYSAHRFSYEYYIGKIKKDNHILHLCDNPKCVNPFHLEQGTHQDNMDDKAKKKREARGSRHGLALLNENEVRKIKEKIRQGYTNVELGEIYLVDHSTISKIRTNRHWRHV